MKRLGNLYAKIYDLDNLREAYRKARRGKGNRYGVKLFEKNLESNLLDLQRRLIDKTYRTSKYETFLIYEPKEREIYRLPFPDRVIHHAIMNILEPIWVSLFSYDTFSCIKKRGIHGAESALRRDLERYPNETIFCLKIDIKKFYPSVDHDKLKMIIRRKIKDSDLLELLDGIIDSASGVPIGNYLSQYLANLYLAYYDHDVKILFGLKDSKKLREAYTPEYIRRSREIEARDNVKERLSDEALAARFRESIRNFKIYKRYADDSIYLSKDKVFLSMLLDWIGLYYARELRLRIKETWQIFPIEDRGIDFVGYVTRHKYVLLRKSIKRNFFRKVRRLLKLNPDISRSKLIQTVCSYYGWCLHCNGRHLLKTIFKSLEDESKMCLPKAVDVSRPRRRNVSLQLQRKERNRKGSSDPNRNADV